MHWVRNGCGGILLELALLGLSGCEAEGRLLRAAATVRLETDSAITLAIDSAGRYWLGIPGALLVRDSGDNERIQLSDTVAPRVLGWMGGRAYLRMGEEVMVVRPGEDSVRALRRGFDDNPILLDVRGRAVLQAAQTGAVLGYDPATLEPLWAWPALALVSTALAVSPEGDRIYQALGTGDDAHRVLIRDLQTGRVLGTEAFPAPFMALVAGRGGVLFGLVRDGRRTAVLALRPREQELELLWRRGLPSAGEEADVRLAVGEGRVAVWGLGPRIGLRLLDTRDGAIVGRTRRDPLDFAFGPEGQLWSLDPEELRLLR